MEVFEGGVTEVLKGPVITTVTISALTKIGEESFGTILRCFMDYKAPKHSSPIHYLVVAATVASKVISTWLQISNIEYMYLQKPLNQ